MKISITGIDGFMGNALKKELSLYPELTLIEQALFKTSLEDKEMLLNKSNDCDIIVHLAAKTFVPDSFNDPFFFYKNNINTTLSVLELCRVKKIKLIYVSSYVYGKPQYFPIDEKHPISDFNPYAHSKIIGEQLCESYAKYFDVQYTILRPFNIYGPNQPAHFLVSKIIKMAHEGIIHLEDPKPKRDYVHVADVADAIIKVILQDEFKGNIFNACSGKSISIQEIVAAVSQKLSKKIEVHYSNLQRPNEIMDTRGDFSKASNILQWQPRHQLIEDILSNKTNELWND